MKTTTNLGFKKIELTDSPPDITVQDTNWDSIDKHLNTAVKYQKASGTGTAITLSEVTLEDGYQKTFIVTANNSSAATKINGKNLYKPGGTVAPNLISGKAVTVWYDLAGDCFFIKASAEGDAVAANVLAGKKFSNDNDTGITGTIPSKTAETITPGTADKEIAASQYLSGVQTIKGDSNLVSANIKRGITIFNVAGKAAVVDTADATAGANHIFYGKTAYANGSKLLGSNTPKVPNQVKDGAFAQPLLNNWTRVNTASASVSGGTLQFVANYQWGHVYQEYKLHTGHKYYWRVVSTGNGTYGQFFITSGALAGNPIADSSTYNATGTQQVLSALLNAGGNYVGDMRFVMGDLRESGWTAVNFKEPLIIDLTEAFGAGKEPTKSEMDALVAAAGWWDTGSLTQRSYQQMADGSWTNGTGMLSLKVPTGAYTEEGGFGAGYTAPSIQDNNFIAKNILNGINIFGVAGLAPKVLTGTALSQPANLTFVTSYNNTLSTVPYIVASGLTFKPKTIIIRATPTTGFGQLGTMVMYKENIVQPGRDCIVAISGAVEDGNRYAALGGAPNTGDYKRYHTNEFVSALGTAAYVNSSGFCIPLFANVSVGYSFTWIALDIAIGG